MTSKSPSMYSMLGMPTTLRIGPPIAEQVTWRRCSYPRRCSYHRHSCGRRTGHRRSSHHLGGKRRRAASALAGAGSLIRPLSKHQHQQHRQQQQPAISFGTPLCTCMHTHIAATNELTYLSYLPYQPRHSHGTHPLISDLFTASAPLGSPPPSAPPSPPASDGEGEGEEGCTEESGAEKGWAGDGLVKVWERGTAGGECTMDAPSHRIFSQVSVRNWTPSPGPTPSSTAAPLRS